MTTGHDFERELRGRRGLTTSRSALLHAPDYPSLLQELLLADTGAIAPEFPASQGIP